MTRTLLPISASLLLVLLLSCEMPTDQPTDQPNDIPTDAPASENIPIIDEPFPGTSISPAHPPKEIDRAEANACAAQGGDYIRAGMLGLPTCIKPTKDAGQSCSSNDQCEGLCLAQTRQCSPKTPLFGCHDVLNDNEQATICID